MGHYPVYSITNHYPFILLLTITRLFYYWPLPVYSITGHYVFVLLLIITVDILLQRVFLFAVLLSTLLPLPLPPPHQVPNHQLMKLCISLKL